MKPLSSIIKLTNISINFYPPRVTLYGSLHCALQNLTDSPWKPHETFHRDVTLDSARSSVSSPQRPKQKITDPSRNFFHTPDTRTHTYAYAYICIYISRDLSPVALWFCTARAIALDNSMNRLVTFPCCSCCRYRLKGDTDSEGSNYTCPAG